MIAFKKALPRRTVLKGLGATLGLPLLDSMVPAFRASAATAAKPVHRLGIVYVPNGMIMKQYLPSAEGREYQLTPTLQGLEPYREQVMVVSGLNCIPSPGRPGGAHAKASTRFLTNVSPPTSETWLDAGPSMDQLLARELGKNTQLPSLELAMESADTAGACDTGFACAYTNTICWRAANTPLPMQNDPRIIFERLFGDSQSTDPKERMARLKQQASLLDSVREELARLQGSLPPSDRTKLDEYLDSVRGIEKRIQVAEKQNHQAMPVVKNPGGIPASWEDHLKLMFDLQTLAYQTDMTRVVTFMLGREHSGMTFPQIGVPDAFHPISHHQGEPDKVEKIAKINAYCVRMFAYLLEKLRSTPDGEGTLLDHITLLYGAGMSDSNTHSPIDIPIVLAGGGAGTLKGGRHIRFKGERLANLHLTLMDNLGVPWDKIGDSTVKVDPKLLSLS